MHGIPRVSQLMGGRTRRPCMWVDVYAVGRRCLRKSADSGAPGAGTVPSVVSPSGASTLYGGVGGQWPKHNNT